MKIKLPCVECMVIEGPYLASFLTTTTPFGDTCLYETTCHLGHTSLIHAQNFKFDLLFESGIKALRDGYYREAVTSFAVALERFYEFLIGIMLIDKLKPQDDGQFDEEAIKKYERLWKGYLKLSERQLGAFYSLYFNEFDEPSIAFDEAFSKKFKYKLVPNPTSFRNRVTHEGYIPSFDEALQYGEAVQNYIDILLKVYKEKDKERRLSRIFNMVWLELALAFMKRGEPIRQITGSGVLTLFHENILVDAEMQPLAQYLKESISKYDKYGDLIDRFPLL